MRDPRAAQADCLRPRRRLEPSVLASRRIRSSTCVSEDLFSLSAPVNSTSALWVVRSGLAYHEATAWSSRWRQASGGGTCQSGVRCRLNRPWTHIRQSYSGDVADDDADKTDLRRVARSVVYANARLFRYDVQPVTSSSRGRQFVTVGPNAFGIVACSGSGGFLRLIGSPAPTADIQLPRDVADAKSQRAFVCASVVGPSSLGVVLSLRASLLGLDPR